jgi:type VI secretion system secreted protein VgrG
MVQPQNKPDEDLSTEGQDVDILSNASGASGGAGSTPAWSDPDIVMSAPAGITMLTPQSASFNAGSTTSVAAGQDINLLAQANLSYSVKGGISLFTYGKASNPKKPNQEVGIKLHAASGKVSSQSQSDKTQITADKGIEVNSTHDAVHIQAKEHVLLTAGGAYIKLSGGNIEVHAPGMVDFKASMKSWTGPKSDSPNLQNLPQQANLKNAIELVFHYDDLLPVPNAPYKVKFEDGTVREGKLDSNGHAVIESVPLGEYTVEYGEDPRAWKPPVEPEPDHKKAHIKAQAKAQIDAERAKYDKENAEPADGNYQEDTV